ncbi:MAG: hypothetical protein KDB03_28885, partial [Planctomycetales bacterium]|nr:hypothetical protein [Planctomycetales bacterium]
VHVTWPSIDRLSSMRSQLPSRRWMLYHAPSNRMNVASRRNLALGNSSMPAIVVFVIELTS